MKNLDHDQHLQEQVSDDEIDNQLKRDHELKLKNNEAYGFSYTHYIPTEDNIAYDQVSNKSTQL